MRVCIKDVVGRMILHLVIKKLKIIFRQPIFLELTTTNKYVRPSQLKIVWILAKDDQYYDIRPTKNEELWNKMVTTTEERDTGW